MHVIYLSFFIDVLYSNNFSANVHKFIDPIILNGIDIVTNIILDKSTDTLMDTQRQSVNNPEVDSLMDNS